MAVANYHDANGRYPPPYVVGSDGRPWHSWRVLILPYIEESELHKAYSFAEPWNGPNNRKLAERMPRLFEFHGSDRPGNTTTNYLAVVGAQTAWPGDRPVAAADVKDGAAKTILLVENDGAGIHWMEPRDLLLADMDLQINSPAGVSSPYDEPAVVMLDGSLERLSLDLKPANLRALFTISGPEYVESDASGGRKPLPDGRQRSRREP